MKNNVKNYMVIVSCRTFNHVNYINEALDGFSMQQTTFPYVCVIIDDASTDGEPEFLSRYMEKHFNLEDNNSTRSQVTDDYKMTFAQHKTNKNCYFAVFLLKYNHFQLKKSKESYEREWREKSKYFALCEGDDYWIDPHKLQRQVDFLELNQDYTMCFHNAFLLKSRNGMMGARHFNNYAADCDLSFNDALFNWVVPTASIVIRCDCIFPTQEWAISLPWADICIIFQSLVAGKVRYLNFYSSVYRQVLTGGSSASANYLKSNYFDTNKRIVKSLTSLHGEIADVAKKRLSFLEKEEKFLNLFHKSKLICLIAMPVYTIKRVWHRITKIKSICWLY